MSISLRDLHARLEEKLIRDLMGAWVSELEPVIVRRLLPTGEPAEIVGLTAVGHETLYVERRYDFARY